MESDKSSAALSYGNFDMEFEIDELQDLNTLLFETIDEHSLLDLLSTTPEGEAEETHGRDADATSTNETESLTSVKAESELDVKPEPLATTSGGRFKMKTGDELDALEASHQSKSTKNNTKWAVNILQDWHMETFRKPLDTMTLSEEDLATTLRKFYCEVAPKESKARTDMYGKSVAEIYHKNSLKNIRSAINRHLSDLGRNVDIVHGTAFKSANRTLDGHFKQATKSGMSRPTKHKTIIEPNDLNKIGKYFDGCETSPIILRHCVWFSVALHFVSRGLEFHHQLKYNSFDFSTDADGNEYMTLNHETQQKYFQGGLTRDEAPTDRRCYATGKPDCPVKLVKLLLAKTDSGAEYLFNCCVKEALVSPKKKDIWFDNKPLSKRTYVNFMPDIRKASNISTRYTAHCIRATAIQSLSNKGFEARQIIMFMSGHRSESSLRSYCTAPSVTQKKSLSCTLSAITSETKPSVDELQNIPPCNPTCALSSVKAEESGQLSTPANAAESVFHSGSFHDCTFSITMNQN